MKEPRPCGLWGDSVRGANRARFFPIGTKLALAVTLVVLSVSTIAAVGLVRREKATLIAAKAASASMVVDLFALTVAAAIDFDDRQAVEANLTNLFSNTNVVYAAVWGASDEPLASRHRPGAGVIESRRPASGAMDRVFPERLVLTRPVLGLEGQPIGVTLVHFTLVPENRQYAQSRVRIALIAFGLAVLIAGFVIGIARWQIVRPLNRLLRATNDLEEGNLTRVAIGANDEIGRVAGSFNKMAATIVERAESLRVANRRVQDLLDHMEQAIVVFRSGGELEAERSRNASRVFGEPGGSVALVQDALYPEKDDVEREAFEQWLEVAFCCPVEAWSEVVELAPKEVKRGAGEEEEALRLEFRAVVEGQRIAKIMLLATDETEKARLQREAKDREAEHARQMAAMRRLVVGGGQVLVSVVESSEKAVERCEQVLSSDQIGSVEINALFRVIHTIKGEARTLDLTALERVAADAEATLADLRSALRGADVISTAERAWLRDHLAKIRGALSQSSDMLVEASPIGAAILDQTTVRRSDLRSLLRFKGRFGGELDRIVDRVVARPFGESTLYLADRVPVWADRLGKRALLRVDGGHVMVPAALSEVLPGVLTHLSRNAVSHGIEDVDTRTARGKEPVGLVSMVAESLDDGGVRVLVADDGRGFDFAALREAATRQGATVDADRLHELPFMEGLTTAENAADLAGRGVGMSAVRSDLKRAGYDVVIESSELGSRLWIVPMGTGVNGRPLTPPDNTNEGNPEKVRLG